MNNLITFEDFHKIEIKIGTIIAVSDFPEAKKPAYKLQIDFGESIGILKSSAQITTLYKKENLLNKQICAVVNFPKKQIGKYMSECLVLGAVDDFGNVTLLTPDMKTENGLPIS